MHSLPKSGYAFFGVFDGHSGQQAADKSAQQLPTLLDDALAKAGSPADDVDALKATFKQVCLDFDSKLDVDDMSGCTAIMALITSKHIIVANVGDSRSVLSSGGETVAMSHDHKPDNAEETRRVEAAGGTVWQGRIDGQLAVSRAFGDFRFKYASDLPATAQPVSPEPDITVHTRDEETEFLILACDGVWDVMTNEEVVGFIHDCVASNMGTWGEVCEAVVDHCLERGSRDNMTIAVVSFPEAGPKLSGVRTEGEGGNPAAGEAEEAKDAGGAGGAGAGGAGASDGSSTGDNDSGEAKADADAETVSVADVPTWSHTVKELAMMDKFAPHLREARTAAASTIVVPSNDGEGDVRVDLSVDVAEGKSVDVDLGLNDIVSVWGGVGKGDLLRLQADAIVVPANGELVSHGGGLYGRTHRLGGPDIRAELAARFTSLAPGEVTITSGHDLPAHNVIHAVVIRSDDAADSTRSCVRKALVAAREHGFRTVAFPPLSASEVGMSMGLCCDLIVSGVRDFLSEGTPAPWLACVRGRADCLGFAGANREAFDRIIFCAISAPASEAFENACRRLFPAGAAAMQPSPMVDAEAPDETAEPATPMANPGGASADDNDEEADEADPEGAPASADGGEDGGDDSGNPGV